MEKVRGKGIWDELGGGKGGESEFVLFQLKPLEKASHNYNRVAYYIIKVKEWNGRTQTQRISMRVGELVKASDNLSFISRISKLTSS